jgi:hypothetical protein
MESAAGRLAVYYPGTREAGKAASLILSEGSEIAADIRMGAPLTEKGHHILGKVTLPPVDVTSPFVQLELKAHDPDGPSDEYFPAAQASTRTSEGVGTFEFRDVRSGDYEITATTRIDARSYTAKTAVQVRDIDVDGVEIGVHPPVEIKGTWSSTARPRGFDSKRLHGCLREKF